MIRSKWNVHFKHLHLTSCRKRTIKQNSTRIVKNSSVALEITFALPQQRLIALPSSSFCLFQNAMELDSYGLSEWLVPLSSLPLSFLWVFVEARSFGSFQHGVIFPHLPMRQFIHSPPEGHLDCF